MKPPPRINTAVDDKLGKGIDLALVTLVFLGVGYGLDRVFGTKPLFMIVLVVLAVVGEFIRFWYAYDAKMKSLESERADLHRPRSCTSRS